MQKNSKLRNVVRTILRWYKQHGRTLPWRNVSNPYRILISEIMLQQTQVSRVLVKYPEFLRRYPTLRSLADAKQRDVVLVWRGMGYNNRAVRLHQLAQLIMHKHHGKIPQDFESLMALPGIGKYTANALLSSAFGKQLPIVDINVQRVVSRIFWRMKSTNEMKSAAMIWELADEILPKGKAYSWNQALMDLGALVCTGRNPRCELCPAAGQCSSRARMKQESKIRTKPEPSLNGIPNRFYRGKIVELLRGFKGTKTIRAHDLGKAIYPPFSQQNVSWLMKLLSGLSDDGLIVVQGNGSFRSTRVSLA